MVSPAGRIVNPEHGLMFVTGVAVRGQSLTNWGFGASRGLLSLGAFVPAFPPLGGESCTKDAVNTSLYAPLRHPWLRRLLYSSPHPLANFSVCRRTYCGVCLVIRLFQFALNYCGELSPTRSGELDVVYHHCWGAHYAHLGGHLQALFYRFFVEFGGQAAAEAAFFEAQAVGVAGEGGYRVVGAAPFALGVVEFVVHLPVLALVSGAAGGLGCGDGVLVLA